jgi:pentatricopeptide repeat protein
MTSKTILQFETDDFYAYTVDLVLYNMGLDGAIRASNKDEARSLFDKIKGKKIRPDVAVVDTYIGNNNGDGEKIAKMLREEVGQIKIVGYSILETASWADFEVIKSGKSQDKTIIKVLEEILGVEYKHSETKDPEYISRI